MLILSKKKKERKKKHDVRHVYGYQGTVSRISLQSCHIAYVIPFYLLTLKYSVCFYNSSYWPKSSVLLFITLLIPIFYFLDSLGYNFCINLHPVVLHCPHTSEVKNMVPLSSWPRTGPDLLWSCLVLKLGRDWGQGGRVRKYEVPYPNFSG